MDALQKSGYYKALEILEELMDEELGPGEMDSYCRHTLEEFIDIMLERME